MKIASLLPKHLAWSNPDMEVQISALPSVETGPTLSTDTHAGTIKHAGRNFDLDGFMFPRRARPKAGLARSPTLRAMATT